LENIIKSIKIDDKSIGNDNSCYTIAEAGANHEGDIEKAKKLIDSAKRAEADSIKFQTYTARNLVTKSAPKYWDDGIKNETQYDVFKKLDSLSNEEWKIIFEYAKEKKISCFSTPFDEQSVDFLYSLNVPAFKIASADITHMPLIKKIAKKNLPIFLSTGMASIDEIHEAVNWIKDCGNNQLVLMHCIISYPTKPEDANLQMISTLTKKFPNQIIGYSDHTIGSLIPAYSVFYGAKCIEKHFTFDTSLDISRDHRLSLDENGFNEMIKNIQIANISKGMNFRDSISAESDGLKYARRSIVSKVKILKGTKITNEMLAIKRPATGIFPKYVNDVIGSIAKQDIDEDIPIKEEYIIKSK
jgi:N,N'-diacetyllegionaminate synthase